jgi:ACS family glucarate transporter-like MFS transporter
MRMLMGAYVAQFCITTLTYFFFTWFPVYLVKERDSQCRNTGVRGGQCAGCRAQ